MLTLNYIGILIYKTYFCHRGKGKLEQGDLTYVSKTYVNCCSYLAKVSKALAVSNLLNLSHMIHELKNFVVNLKEEDFSRNLKLKEGIYILIDIEKKGEEYILKNENEIFQTQEDIAVYDEKNKIEDENLFLSLLVNIKPASPAKTFNPNKKIYNASCSPFALAFNKKNFAGKPQKILIKELSQYFQSAERYATEPQHQIWFYDFKAYCLNHLLSFLERLPEYQKAKTNTSIYIFLKKPGLEDFVQTHQAYLAEKVFNKDKFNVETTEGTFGVSDSLSGFNNKKMFLKHHSAPLEYNYRISGETAMQLWRFFQLQQNKQIPNPVPIFVDDQEKKLNEKMISIFNTEEKKIGHAEMIKKILSRSGQENLQNYYLIYFSGTKGSRVADIDFIPVLRYEERGAKIEEMFALGGKQVANKIETVFDLENHVFNRIFNGQLRTDTWLKYFGEIKYDPKYTTDTCYNQLLRYRQPIYDFVYKSKRQAITANMFDDMMAQGILDDIRHDEVKDGNHDKGYAIKEKLNIWFSLYKFFTDTTQKNRNNMVNQTEELKDFMNELILGSRNINNDKELAFTVGQVIYYLLDKSESSDKSYSRLIPFLQKTNYEEFKKALVRVFEMYMHKTFSRKFKHPYDQALMCETNTNVKELLPTILAGFFSDNMLYADKKSENDSNPNEN